MIAGSAQTVADQLEEWVEQTGVDGFNLAATAVPEAWEQIADLLVPELQSRGRFKTEYEPGTLREKLGAPGPRLTRSIPSPEAASR